MGKTRRAPPKKSAAAGKGGDHGSTEHSSSAKGRKGNKKNKASNISRATWAGDVATDLAALGLRVHEMAADGSCFFRSLDDQMGGAGGDFRELRQRIVAYMKEHRDDFEPFVEDDEPFDNYVKRMGEEGTWAGNLELQAASMELQANLRVYQAGQPVWTIKNFPENAPMLHLSYHDGMHYNSVRMANDFGSGPPVPICVPEGTTKGAGINAKGTKGGDGTSGGGTKDGSFNKSLEVSERDINRVLDGTGCSDKSRAENALQNARGDVDNAILQLAEELAAGAEEETPAPEEGRAAATAAATSDKSSSGTGLEEHLQGSNFLENSEDEVRVELEVSRGGKGRKVQLHIFIDGIEFISSGGSGGGGSTVKAEGRGAVKLKKQKGKSKAPSRNSRCPCGSTKKYKNCCGAASGGRKVEETTEILDSSSSAATATKALETLYI